jgi:alcohol dehydrogenase class IV
MIDAFRYEPKPARVLFGAGRIAEARQVVEGLGARRALVLSTANHAELGQRVKHFLGDMAAGTFAGAIMHTPVDVTEKALAVLESRGADCLVAVGGGSTIGLGKALALRTDLPQVCIPTTYAGSEMTDILGETKDGTKTTQRGPRILPEAVIYDVELTLSLPARVSAASGMNAIAHAIEALYAPDRNPVIELMAEESIRRLAAGLSRIAIDGQDRGAREDALLGAFLAGTCLGAAAMALHHKLCHVLGGLFNLPHAETHAVMLPYTAAFNFEAVPLARTRVVRALDGADLFRLKEKLVGQLSLKDLGMPEAGIEQAARVATANPYSNPRPFTPEMIRDLIAKAYRGEAP